MLASVFRASLSRRYGASMPGGELWSAASLRWSVERAALARRSFIAAGYGGGDGSIASEVRHSQVKRSALAKACSMSSLEALTLPSERIPGLGATRCLGPGCSLWPPHGRHI